LRIEFWYVEIDPFNAASEQAGDDQIESLIIRFIYKQISLPEVRLGCGRILQFPTIFYYQFQVAGINRQDEALNKHGTGAYAGGIEQAQHFFVSVGPRHVTGSLPETG